MNYLIIGGTSQAGQAAIDAIRNEDEEAYIVATTSRTENITRVDETITGIDLSVPDASDRVVPEICKQIQERVDALIFTPAFGPVGYPAEEASESDVSQALSFSYHPLVKVTEALKPGITIGYSSFFWLPHISIAYGAMGATKHSVERLAVEHPERYRVIRSGTFFSKSTRGISLMVRRALRKTTNPTWLKLAERWKETGSSFEDFFFDFAHDTEREAYQGQFPDTPHRRTTATDLGQAVIKATGGNAAPILNVIGDWIWDEAELPTTDAYERASAKEALERAQKDRLSLAV